MHNLLFFTDPHLGLKRAAHTTAQSSKRLNQRIEEQVDQILAEAESETFCLGDLFDNHSIEPKTFLKGYEVVQKCEYVLTGNHDVSNREDKLSSMQVIKQIAYGENCIVDNTKVGNCIVTSVNHQLTQGLFEQTLNDLIAKDAQEDRILLLHCNYDSPFATDESSLNLSEEMAIKLLEHFDYILLGHEHQPRVLLDGRLFILGNVHPTSFSDISDKFFYVMTVGEDGFKPPVAHKVWDSKRSYLSIPWTDLSELTELDSAVQFVEVTGEADPRHLPTVAKQVADLWRLSDHLLMVKNKVTATDLTPELGDGTLKTGHVNIPEIVAESLSDSPLKPLWEQYLEKVNYA